MKIDNFTPSEKIFEKRIAIEDENKLTEAIKELTNLQI